MCPERMGGSARLFPVFQKRWILGGALCWCHGLNGIPWIVIPTLCAALGDFSVGLFPQESEISEHMKELQFSDSVASDSKSYLGLVSLL